MKYYAVKHGFVPGIYQTWNECKKQVDNFSGAVFKSFPTKEQAEEFVGIKKSSQVAINDVYFDGGCRNGRAGGACYIVNSNTVYYQRVLPDLETKQETNNRGELTGLILALTYSQGDVNIYGDSLYALKIGAKEWKNKNNQDLVNKIHKLTKNRNIQWHHVDAHTGIYGNEVCDMYATKALGVNNHVVHKLNILPDE